MKILFLAHRAPWPPDKGDRIRSHAILARLARRHEVLLVTFADGRDAAEARRVEEHLRPLCARVHVFPRPPLTRALRGLVSGRPFSFEHLRTAAFDACVREVLAGDRPDAVFGFSGQVLPWLLDARGMPRVIDLVDVDSAKWSARHRRTGNPVHGIEARRVRHWEERALRELDGVLVTTPREADLLGGEGGALRVVRNGVDFGLCPLRTEDPGGARIGFVGALDYAPNARGALWFAREVLPRVRESRPDARFVVVGRRPPAELQRLPGVDATGYVEELAAVMHGFALTVVPVFEAHGVQTKALVSMSMGVPVVISPAAADGAEIQTRVHAAVAGDAPEFAAAVLRLLDNADERARLSAAARRWVETRRDWDRNLAVLERLLDPTGGEAASGPPAGRARAVDHVGRTRA